MKDALLAALQKAIAVLHEQGLLDTDALPSSAQITRTRDASHGDFACNVAMVLAKAAKMPPRQLAEKLIAELPSTAEIVRTEVAGPGFINFYVSHDVATSIVPTVLTQGEDFGRGKPDKPLRMNVEFVSANPTGPLHVGHGRGAASGASLSSLLRFAGHEIDAEYYVNDAGRQMDILGTSVWLRYLQACGEVFTFPSNAYQGDYLPEMAESLLREHGQALRHSAEVVFADVPADAPQGGDKEAHIDALIAAAKRLLQDDYRLPFNIALESILADIRQDLGEFGVHYQTWFSEASLHPEKVDAAVAELTAAGHMYEKDGNVWFRSSDFGDEKDRVVRRASGSYTYFASDIAYLRDKFARGYEHLLYVFGADHHGYVPRVRAIAEAFGYDQERVEFCLVQFAVLYRQGEKVQMSTRSGEFIPLRELRNEIGNDAARWFYVMRSTDQHMDFDLDLAKKQSSDNPMYYVQYAHARICRVLEQAQERGWAFDREQGEANLGLLTSEMEAEILTALAAFPERIESASRQREVHNVCNYLRELAASYHSWYNSEKALIEDAALRNARLALMAAAQQVLANGLRVLGVSAPTQM